ncbi:hypothetical protein Vadar_024377 [Vaccinium darrowii]|uniref:Uncharacterized protein n=1 Tax=Vaccinium darrowii TaxID=229202 RepID=A0ACB7ZL17_9ERIC|nr:hypothetical protein Vadar_024377 [Vaccinium darrowii]
MGLSSELETLGSLEVVELYNPLRDTITSRKKGSLKVLYECGIYNMFLLRSEVPAGWGSNNKRTGSSITFNVPSLPNIKIQALKIHIVYPCFRGNDRLFMTSLKRKIANSIKPILVIKISPMLKICQHINSDQATIIYAYHQGGRKEYFEDLLFEEPE